MAIQAVFAILAGIWTAVIPEVIFWFVASIPVKQPRQVVLKLCCASVAKLAFFAVFVWVLLQQLSVMPVTFFASCFIGVLGINWLKRIKLQRSGR